MDLDLFESLVLIVHVIAAVAVVGLVLIQHGKGSDMVAGFGSGASGTVFGSGGAGNFLTRLTTWIAIAFFLTSFALAYVAKQRSEQVAALGMPEIESSAEIVIPAEIPGSVDSESFDSEIPAVPVE